MYRYETHLHTAPVSKCAKATVEDSLRFYKEFGYDGVFITDHFLDGNLNMDKSEPYEDKLRFYVSAYESGVEIGRQIGLKVFFGVELSYGGTDFLIYGLDPQWYFDHPEIMDMTKSEELKFMREQGAFVVQAHPFREAAYIDHIRLYPRDVDAVEVINSNRKDEENQLAGIYAEHYGLIRFAGSDNHRAGAKKKLAGMCSEEPINDVADFVQAVKEGRMQTFQLNREE